MLISNSLNLLISLTKEKIESILFHISGMFPDVVDIPNEETSEYMRTSMDIWSSVKNNYDSGLLNKNEWNFFKLDHKIFQLLE